MLEPARTTRTGSNHKQGRRQQSGTDGYTSPPHHVTVVPPTSTLVVAAAKRGPGRHHPHAGKPTTEPGWNQDEVADHAIVTTEGCSNMTCDLQTASCRESEGGGSL